MNILLRCFTVITLCCITRLLCYSQNPAKWEIQTAIQFNKQMIHTNNTVFNPQYHRLTLNRYPLLPTSLDFQILKNESRYWKHGVRAGGIILGGDYFFDVLHPQAAPLAPLRLNMHNVSLRYFAASYNVHVNIVNTLERFLLRTAADKKESVVNLFASVGVGAIMRLSKRDQPNQTDGSSPTIYTSPSGDIARIDEDYYNKAAANGFVNAELTLQVKATKQLSVNFSISKIHPFRAPLFEVRQEFTYNNQLITSAVSDGGAPMSAARIGIAYHFNQFPFVKNKNKK
jgi:hypothetical protein